MRRLRYALASSLDGFIGGPNGEYDWIEMNPAQVDPFFKKFYAQFDTAIMGRKSFEQYGGAVDGMDTYVFSRTLSPADQKSVTVIGGKSGLERVAELRSGGGKDIWLFGGGVLFGSLARAGLVDTVEVAIFPVILGAGLPLMSGCDSRVRLKLEETDTSLDGVVGLTYSVER
jgi:dihydrofolate reductase